MSTLSKQIDRYVEALLSGDAEIVHAQAAEAFIAEHGDVIGFHVEEIVRRQITQAIKRRSQAPAPPLGQGVLFQGFPAAVTVRDGVTKPINLCTRSDLYAGREQKVENIAAAQSALTAYDTDLAQVEPHLRTETATVADAVRTIRGTA